MVSEVIFLRSFSGINNDNKNMLSSIIIGVIVSVCMIAVMMCIAAVVLLTSSQLPYEYLDYIMLTIDAVAVLLGGYIGARINKSRGLLVGTAIGISVFIVIVICGFSSGSDNLSVLTLIRGVILVIFSAVGGIKGVNVKEKIKIK